MATITNLIRMEGTAISRRRRALSTSGSTPLKSKGQGTSASSWQDDWLSPNLNKRGGELYLLAYQPLWLLFFGGVVVTGVYKDWSDFGYLMCGAILSLPVMFAPVVFPMSEREAAQPWYERYSFKANIFICIMNFVGNYFWTHYFFVCLGCSYTFPVTYFWNSVPVALYGITQSYFTLYYIFSSIAIRVRRLLGAQGQWTRWAVLALLVLAMSWFFAFMETWTIESVPYYVFVSRDAMYHVGVTFYALYFLPSFPMFCIIDEEEGETWSLWTVAKEAFASAMIVFILCDFWRVGMDDYMTQLIGTAVNSSKVPFVNKA